MAPPPREYPKAREDYELLEEIGTGVSGTVWRAKCIPFNEAVAVKVLDLERQDPRNLEEIRRECQTMRMMSHPNLVAIHSTFVTGQHLWIVMPFCAGGSVLNIMKYDGKKGIEEAEIAAIMKGVLTACEYCHKNNLIHRDIKAGNILLDADGTVKLADFGVSASCWGSQELSRHKTFIGTPCWMAPEVMDQKSGYDTAADIWSLGITMYELANGHAPYAKQAPLKVLLMTLQNSAPKLEDTATKRFSKGLQEIVAQCLQKDPKMRPSAAKLLENKYFKGAKDKDFLVQRLLAGRPSLAERTRQIKNKETAKGVEEDESAEGSGGAKGVSAWDFNMTDMRKAAARETLPPVQERPAEEQLLSPVDSNLKNPKQKGRFDVYEEDNYGGMTTVTVPATPQTNAEPEKPPTATNAPAAALLERSGSTVSNTSISEGAAAPAAKEKKEPKKKGRFTLMREEVTDDSNSMGAAGEEKVVVAKVPASPSTATMLTGHLQEQILAQLQAIQAQQVQQLDLTAQLTTSLVRSSSGMSSNTGTPGGAATPPLEQDVTQTLAEMNTRIAALLDENRHLKQRNKELERKVKEHTAK